MIIRRLSRKIPVYLDSIILNIYILTPCHCHFQLSCCICWKSKLTLTFLTIISLTHVLFAASFIWSFKRKIVCCFCSWHFNSNAHWPGRGQAMCRRVSLVFLSLLLLFELPAIVHSLASLTDLWQPEATGSATATDFTRLVSMRLHGSCGPASASASWLLHLMDATLAIVCKVLMCCRLPFVCCSHCHSCLRKFNIFCITWLTECGLLKLIIFWQAPTATIRILYSPQGVKMRLFLQIYIISMDRPRRVSLQGRTRPVRPL